MTVTDALMLSLIGMVLIMAVLFFLMLIIKLMSYLVNKGEVQYEKNVEKKTKPQHADGTCGDLKLIDTNEKEAALIMAIVADTLNEPLNELRFISIKKIKEDK